MIHGAQYEDDDGGSFTTTPTFFQNSWIFEIQEESPTVVLSHSLFDLFIFHFQTGGRSKRILLLPKGA